MQCGKSKRRRNYGLKANSKSERNRKKLNVKCLVIRKVFLAEVTSIYLPTLIQHLCGGTDVCLLGNMVLTVQRGWGQSYIGGTGLGGKLEQASMRK